MQNRSDMENFNKQLKILIENIRSGIRTIEEKELDIRQNEISPLGKILSEISISDIEIDSMSEISGSTVLKEKIISFLTNEMIFINSKNPYPDETKLTPNKWWKAVEVVLESIANYFKIPYWDIILEIVKLGSIITRVDFKINNPRNQ